MPETSPTPPARAVGKPPGAAPKVPEAKPAPGGIIPAGLPYTARFRNALAQIDEHVATPTSARSSLSGYYRYATPTLTLEHLPRSLKPHATHKDRSAIGSKWDVFFFLLGHTVDKIQTAYRTDLAYARVHTSHVDQKVAALADTKAAIQRMDSAVANLETLATIGPDQWRVDGDDKTGYTLIPEAQRVSEMLASQAARAAAEQARHDADTADDDPEDQVEEIPAE